MKAFAGVVIATIASMLTYAEGGHICGYDAQCIINVCVCPANYIGDPDFDCYDPKVWYRCRLKCDPTLQMYDGKNASLHLFTANTLSIANTPLTGHLGSGTCKLEVSSFPMRFNGKFFIFCVGFTLTIKPWLVIKVRIYAKVVKDSHGNIIYYWYIYVFRRLQNKFVYLTTLSNTGQKDCTEEAPKCRINFHVCSKSNFLVVKFGPCGQLLGIRPYNPFNRNIPGVFIKVKRTAATRFVGLPDALCNMPSGGKNIDKIQKEFKFDNRKQVMTFYILRQLSPDDYPGCPSQVKELSAEISNCDKGRLVEFIKRGELLFSDVRLINCLGVNKMKPLFEVILRVLKAYCGKPLHRKHECLEALKVFNSYCGKYPYYIKLKYLIIRICYGL